MTRFYRWRDASGAGLEHLALTQSAQKISARSVAIHGALRFACSYTVECDADWRFRHATIEILGGKKREIAFYPPAGWTCDGEPLVGFEDANEIDLEISPFTNTLPIRRLKLKPGQSASIVTAWVSFPDLDVFPDPQRYTCVEAGLYRFESLDSDFKRDIAVDDDGLVVDYPGLFALV